MKTKEELEKLKNKRLRRFCRFLFIISFFMGVALILGTEGYINLRRELGVQKEYTRLLCEMTNIQSDLLDKTMPKHNEKLCEDYIYLVNDSRKAEIFCNQLNELKLPDKFDCEDYR